MNFSDHYFKEADAKEFADEVRLILEEESASIGINHAFISGLSNYLEKRFPAYGDFDVAIGNEIRKYMKADNSYVKQVKKRIHDIINKCKARFLHDITIKVEKIKVQPKDPILPPNVQKNPLVSTDEEEPMTGEMPTNV